MPESLKLEWDGSKTNERHLALFRESLCDNNINALLFDETSNRDIFRALLFQYNTDNYIPIEKAATFVQQFLRYSEEEDGS